MLEYFFIAFLAALTHLEVFLFWNDESKGFVPKTSPIRNLFFSSQGNTYDGYTVYWYIQFLQTNKIYEANQISLHEGLNRRTKDTNNYNLLRKENRTESECYDGFDRYKNCYFVNFDFMFNMALGQSKQAGSQSKQTAK